jgi:DNA-binding NtrC family response regulator
VLHSCHVLIVSTDPVHREKSDEIFRRLGLQTLRCGSLMDARARIEEQTFQFVLCSDDLPDCNLRTAVSVLTSATAGAPVIVISHLADWEAYLKALGTGAFDYLAWPADPGEMERIFRLALEKTLRRAVHPTRPRDWPASRV